MTGQNSNIERVKFSIRTGRDRAMLIGALLFLCTVSVAPFSDSQSVKTLALTTGMIAAGIIMTAVFMPRAEESDIDAIVADMPRKVDPITDDERRIDAEWKDRLNDLSSPGGFVYVIHDITITNYYKIGRSSSVNRRFIEFAAKFPFQYTIAHVIPSHDSHELERVLHRQFAAKRITGSEWFALSPADVAWIRKLEVC